MNKMLLVFVVCASALCATENLNTIEISAPTVALSKHLLSSDIESVSSQDIHEEVAQSVPDILESRLPFVSNGGFGQPESFYLRGMDTSNTLFIVDGVRVNDISAPSPAASVQDFLLSDIYSVDIIKGAQSGAYGADAVAGVVSITTKRPQEGLHASVDSSAGTYGYTRNAVTVSYKNALLYAAFTGSKMQTSGFSAAAPQKGESGYGKFDGSLESDRYDNAYTSFLFGVTPSKQDTLEVNYKKIDSFVAYDGYNNITYQLDPNDSSSHYNSRQVFVSSRYTHTFDAGKIDAFYNDSTFNRTEYGGYDARQQDAGAQGQYNYAGASYVSAGFDRLESHVGLSGGTNIGKNLSTKGVFVSNTNVLGPVLVTQTVRKDFYDTFDSKMTGKIGARVFIGDASIFSNYASAYKTPSLYQTYGDGIYVMPNTHLKPEDTRNVDFGFEYGGFKISYFYYDVNNLIEYQSNDYANSPGHSIIQGYEASFAKRFGNISTSVDYQRIDARDAVKKPLINRPSYVINSRFVYYVGDRLNMGISADYVGNRTDYDGASTGNYTLVGLTANAQLTKHIELYAKARNILNRYYQSIDGYNGYSASILFGARVSF